MSERLKKFKIICNECKSNDVYYNGTTEEINVLCNNCGTGESLKLEIDIKKED